MTNFSDYLDNLKSSLEESSDEARSDAISEGISHMKEGISEMQFQKNVASNSGRKADLGKWSEGIKRAPKSVDPKVIADRAIDTYKNSVVPKYNKEIELGIESPTDGHKIFTKAQQENIVAAARALAGQRNSGDVGKATENGPNGGDLGTQTVSGQNGGDIGRSVGNPAFSSGVTPGNLTVGEEKEESLEDYQARIFESFGLVNELNASLAKAGREHYQRLRDEGSMDYKSPRTKAREKAAREKSMKEEVAELASALNNLEDCSWQQVDKTTREVALDYGTTLKDLNKAFREEFGQYPDKWINEQVIAEECGMMPLAEVARVVATGLLYDVSMMWRGKTIRMQFFYPEAGRPTREQMQKAVEKFYPTARLIAYYPSKEQDAGAFIMIPPMSESYVVLDESDWVELSEQDALAYEVICEEVGEPILSPVALEEGGFAVLVSDHDTGEELTVTFGEGVLDIFKDKRSPEEKKHAKLTKMSNELDRLTRQSKDKHSDDSKSAAAAAKRPRKAPETKKVYARKVSEKKPVVTEQSGSSNRDGKPSGQDTRKITLKPQALRQARARRDAFLKSLTKKDDK